MATPINWDMLTGRREWGREGDGEDGDGYSGPAKSYFNQRFDAGCIKLNVFLH